MGFYSDRILPHLIRRTMAGRDFVPYRERIVARAEGRVLEIGIGAGDNLRVYGPRVCEVIGLEPHPRLAGLARRAGNGIAVPVQIVEATAERIPLDAGSVDTVVTTWTLCSITDIAAALAEMRRVLKPDGRMLFVEHGLAPDRGVRWVQQRITPVWKRLAGGCHLDRPMNTLIANAGFRIEQLDTGYMRGVRPLAFLYEGAARPD